MVIEKNASEVFDLKPTSGRFRDSVESCRIPVMPSIPELLNGHVTLEVECLDRLYLNGYIGSLASNWASQSPRRW